MLSIAVYSDQPEDVAALKILIQDYLIESKTVAKLSCFQKSEDMIIIPNRYDIYFIDMDSAADATTLGKQMRMIDESG